MGRLICNLNMIIKLQLISLYILQLGWSLPVADNSSKILVNNDVNDNLDDKDDKVVQCKNVFTNAGLNYSSFFAGAAHGIHSLSLEEIRHFFKPDAPEDNKIPTVNIDFRSENVIHFSAPLWGYSDRFDTWALKIMDWFMLNDHPYLYETGINAMEKFSHQYHMHEIFTKAAKIYNELLENPPKNESLCMCANDVTSNGILAEVVNIAKQLKYRARQGRARPSAACGPSARFYRGYRGYGPRGGVEYYDGIVFNRRKREATKDQAELEEAYLSNSTKDTAEELLAVSPWIPGNFTRPDQWISYSAMLTYSLPSEQGIRDFATFIYCKLNKAELDHPVDLF